MADCHEKYSLHSSMASNVLMQFGWDRMKAVRVVPVVRFEMSIDHICMALC